MQSYVEYIKELIGRELYNHENFMVYGCELAHTLAKNEKTNRYKALDYIKHWVDEAVIVYINRKDIYGECCNPFENPEMFYTYMIIDGVCDVLNQCQIVIDNWNKEIKLTEEIIDIIREDIRDVEEIDF